MPSYNPGDIERRWQDYWQSRKTFRTPDVSDKPKYYILDMFPYPSGSGLHVGHPEGYTATDILARYRRMCGFNVLHPMGWDAFGLPAEQYAIETGTHPRATTEQNINTFRRQIQMLGFSYDWDREVDTTDPGYFRWTQWIFLQLHDTWYDAERKKGRSIRELPIPPDVTEKGDVAVRLYRDRHRLAYQSEIPVNWCPALGTVLANEEVQDGVSERGGHPVIRMPLKQWMLRITAYAERLLADLEPLEWSESIKEMQRNWIGRSEGAEVDFAIAGSSGKSAKVRVFTTRPDTLFGATYMVLSPEHPLVESITSAEQRSAVAQYCTESARKSDFERTELAKKKTGVFTGAFAINPVNHEKIPIWIADYVLASYGTGAIMAVPSHDERDFEFAKQFGLSLRTVVRPPDAWLEQTGSTLDQFTEAFTGEGAGMNSGSFDGLDSMEFKKKITGWLQERKLGQGKVNYKLRDWIFSRQRYWGEPFPLLHELDDKGEPTGVVEALDISELPLRLPDLEDYKPSGRPEPPLGKATDWLYVTRNGKRYRRETNTMPQWAGSCWYYLRYLDPRNEKSLCDPAKEKYWMSVDLYVGGAEHAVLHLLYARFWHKVLFDRGHVHTPEPFQRLVNQGMILGDNNEKMSKARGNVINPDDVVKEYGADSLRLYEMFMGPLEAVKPWSMRGVEGVYRFLGRVWRLFIDDHAESLTLVDAVQDAVPDRDTSRRLHYTIQKVTDDLDHMRFNTAIAAMMELTNHLTPMTVRPRAVLETLVLLLSPFAPHLAEELWRALGHNDTLAYEKWPKFDPALLQVDEIEVAVQINGKVRLRLTIPAGLEGAAFQQTVLDHEQVKVLLAGKTVKKVIPVPGKLINIVVG